MNAFTQGLFFDVSMLSGLMTFTNLLFLIRKNSFDFKEYGKSYLNAFLSTFFLFLISGVFYLTPFAKLEINTFSFFFNFIIPPIILFGKYYLFWRKKELKGLLYYITYVPPFILIVFISLEYVLQSTIVRIVQ